MVDSSAWARKNGNVNTYDENTIVFRSYSDPDNSTTSTRLKVKYTNKVKTGTITIQKQQAAVSDDLSGTYTFKVKFFNVAGMGLEGTTPIEKEYHVKKNASGKFDPIVISGIPAGTQYTISEISLLMVQCLKAWMSQVAVNWKRNTGQLTHIMRKPSLLKCQVL